MLIAFHLIPVATREVGHLHRHTAIGDGGGGQLTEAGPFGGVVDVLVKRQAMLQAVDEAIVHDEVHAAMSANFLGFLFNLYRDGVEVFFHDHVAHLGRNEAVRVEFGAFGQETGGEFVLQHSEAFDGVFVGKAFGAGKLIQAVVGPIGVDVMFNQESLAFLGLDHRGGHVAVGEVIDAHQFLGDFLAIVGRRAHTDEGLHAVAAVDIEGLAEGPEAVGGVDVAGMGLVEFKTPVFVVFAPIGLQVMDVGAFAMDEFAEHALLGHVEGGQLEEVVAAVLEHHAVALGLFGHVDELPAFFNGGGSRHFEGHVFAMLHGVGGHHDMGLPVGADVDEVDVIALAELAPAVAARIGSGTWQFFCFKDLGLNGFYAVGLNVTEGHDGHAVNVGHAVDGIGTAHAEADEADTDILDRGDGELKDALLTFDAQRLVEEDAVVDDDIVALAGVSSSLGIADEGSSQQE